MIYQSRSGRVRIGGVALVAAVAVGLLVGLAGAVHGSLEPRIPQRRAKGVPGDQITFRKVVLDREFRSEGVAVADVNRDGRPDVLAGDLWYQAPSWTPHEIEAVQKYDGEHGYSNSFECYAADVNRDGWPDEIVIGMPGGPAVWRENPKGATGHWKEHQIWRSACNESPVFADLTRTRKPVLVFPFDEKTMAWYEPGPALDQDFVCHEVGQGPGVQRFSHGLGVGDVNGDGRPDIITTEGWYQAPADPRTGPWPFVRAGLGPASAYMRVYDVNGDGLPDVISSSAHEYGVWWFEQQKGPNGPTFVQHTIDKTCSETHALELVDMNGDGLLDFVTGKRFWAHGPTGDPGAGEPAMLYWYELKRPGGKVDYVRHQIDDDSGVGTQFTVADMNRDSLPDVIVANKKGVFVFLQARR